MLPWALVVVWMGVIFSFSAQTGTASGSLSAVIADAIQNLFPGIDRGALVVGVRKSAHMTEYAVLGGLLALALRAGTVRGRAWLAVAGGIAYAVIDETHQTFVPGRAGAVGDVLIDSVGVLLGVGAIYLWSVRRRRME